MAGHMVEIVAVSCIAKPCGRSSRSLKLSHPPCLGASARAGDPTRTTKATRPNHPATGVMREQRMLCPPWIEPSNPIRHDDVNASLNEVLRERGQPLRLTFRCAVFEDDRSPFNVAELAQTLKQRVPKFPVVEQTDPRHLPRLLRLRGKRRPH